MLNCFDNIVRVPWALPIDVKRRRQARENQARTVLQKVHGLQKHQNSMNHENVETQRPTTSQASSKPKPAATLLGTVGLLAVCNCICWYLFRHIPMKAVKEEKMLLE
jgi:hypothetical protein